jgi:hypothetical protein
MDRQEALTPATASSKPPRVFDPHDTPRMLALAGTPLARFWPRFAAYCIDISFVLVTYVPMEFARQYLVARFLHHEENIHFDVKFDFHEVGNLVWLVLYYGLSVWMTNGRTIGKWLMGLRVVSLTHRKISFWQAVERALGYGASALECFFGFYQFFLNHNRQCVHDRIAETIVICEPRKGPETTSPAV